MLPAQSWIPFGIGAVFSSASIPLSLAAVAGSRERAVLRLAIPSLILGVAALAWRGLLLWEVSQFQRDMHGIPLG
jgi:hypothetical protein